MHALTLPPWGARGHRATLRRSSRPPPRRCGRRWRSCGRTSPSARSPRPPGSLPTRSRSPGASPVTTRRPPAGSCCCSTPMGRTPGRAPPGSSAMRAPRWTRRSPTTRCCPGSPGRGCGSRCSRTAPSSAPSAGRSPPPRPGASGCSPPTATTSTSSSGVPGHHAGQDRWRKPRTRRCRSRRTAGPTGRRRGTRRTLPRTCTPSPTCWPRWRGCRRVSPGSYRYLPAAPEQIRTSPSEHCAPGMSTERIRDDYLGATIEHEAYN
ncbi:hypothetical protein FRAHR75_30090 [Frankia sp. Hr75.2]|nr:hypothetical protein FRAHR75_30090 [Frankia sp. Hr75.2]